MTIRPAKSTDWDRIGELSELLVRAHHGYDPARFFPADKLPRARYVSLVREEVDRGSATVLVADANGQIGGYVFGGIEAESWKELRHEAGYVHDLVVDETARQSGLGAALIEALIAWFGSRGVRRIMLWSATQNAGAQRLFRRVGFRPTMVEMTLDVEPANGPPHRK